MVDSHNENDGKGCRRRPLAEDTKIANGTKRAYENSWSLVAGVSQAVGFRFAFLNLRGRGSLTLCPSGRDSPLKWRNLIAP
jgi:hypothetical protein